MKLNKRPYSLNATGYVCAECGEIADADNVSSWYATEQLPDGLSIHFLNAYLAKFPEGFAHPATTKAFCDLLCALDHVGVVGILGPKEAA